MTLSKNYTNVIKEILSIEHNNTAINLNFIEVDTLTINRELLIRAIGMLDSLSRNNDERSNKIIVTISAILWIYRDKSWDGLRDFLILILSRIGFCPSAIMVGTDGYQEASTLLGLNSLINQINVTVHQINHEIFINEKKFLVTGFQKRVWDKLGKTNVLGISAPTSAGKSFIILLKIVDIIIKKDGNIVYIVPTLSLVAQVSNDINRLLKQFNITNYRISTTYSYDESSLNRIYILTQEKAISSFSQSEKPYKNVLVLVVDEIQNVERYSDHEDQRAKTLYDVLIEFRHTCSPEIAIISGPRIDGLKQFGIEVFNNENIDEEKAKDSPVASITYSISLEKNKYFFNQYCDVLETNNTIEIKNSSIIKDYGKSLYAESFIAYLSQFIKFLGNDSRNIIFSPTAMQARKTATQLAALQDPMPSTPHIDSLVKYLKDTVHENYDMCLSIPKGFVYHHGKTPAHVRTATEYAIRNKLVSNVVCTTTLMQGINLPAQNVIMRNPFLAIKAKNGKKPKLTNYEIANLRGRAGRLLKDVIGRTFILEETTFEKEENQLELFPEAEKQLKSGYGEKYELYKKEIHESLSTGITLNENNKEYAFLTTYIRQIILKHKEKSLVRLNSVGINLAENEISKIKESLSNMEIPLDICFKNRYWDPLDLNELYKKSENIQLPFGALESNAERKIETALNFMKDNFNFYFKKYFDIHETQIFSASIAAKDWMREASLKQILSSSYHDSPEKIEEKISLLQNKIAYGLPTLLKPLYDIKNPENMFLRFIEIGAFNVITRKMIELNIPRETAIYLNRKYFSNFSLNKENAEESIIEALKKIKPELDYWNKIQIENII